MGERWDAGDIPDQTGRIAVVTGANSGLGLVTARELAPQARASSWPAATSTRGAASRRSRPSRRPEPELEELDLASLSSVRSFAAASRQSTTASTC
jgi:NAD(P)-dependent dehydrogenase (short-subunit alcohol dehydrogenase family)